MSKTFRPYEPDQMLLMPASLREWLAPDHLAPGVNSRHILLYGVEVKFYSSRLELSPSLETQVKNLFACGDGVGVTRGLVQASASGVVAARAILERVKEGASATKA